MAPLSCVCHHLGMLLLLSWVSLEVKITGAAGVRQMDGVAGLLLSFSFCIHFSFFGEGSKQASIEHAYRVWGGDLPGGRHPKASFAAPIRRRGSLDHGCSFLLLRGVPFINQPGQADNCAIRVRWGKAPTPPCCTVTMEETIVRPPIWVGANGLARWSRCANIPSKRLSCALSRERIGFPPDLTGL
jgi:hypothetical protein